jgi:hypothetical protein
LHLDLVTTDPRTHATGGDTMNKLKDLKDKPPKTLPSHVPRKPATTYASVHVNDPEQPNE